MPVTRQNPKPNTRPRPNHDTKVSTIRYQFASRVAGSIQPNTMNSSAARCARYNSRSAAISAARSSALRGGAARLSGLFEDGFGMADDLVKGVGVLVEQLAAGVGKGRQLEHGFVGALGDGEPDLRVVRQVGARAAQHPAPVALGEKRLLVDQRVARQRGLA